MHVSVIAKEPRAGFVKTRLCPPCTPETAAAIAGAALLDTLDAVDQLITVAHARGHDVRPVLLFDGDPSEWVRPGYTVVVQRGDGLEERLANGFDELGPGFVVGMETPLAAPSIVDGLDAIADGGDAIGLATDGGYWVIGLGAVDRRVFADIPMSRSNTGLAQLARLHALSRRVRLLAMARDLDTYADVEAVARAHQGTRLTRAAREVIAANG
jgi:uncharacterized protein